MATSKSKAAPKLLSAGGMRVSWRRLIIWGSFALNVGFIVIWVTYISGHSLDGLFMADGLDRYCSTQNDDKFSGSTAGVTATRDFVCVRPDAEKSYTEGFNKYLDSKNIPHSTTE